MITHEYQVQEQLRQKLRALKNEYLQGIRGQSALKENIRAKLESLNRFYITDRTFQSPLDEIITPHALSASRTQRTINAFTGQAQA